MNNSVVLDQTPHKLSQKEMVGMKFKVRIVGKLTPEKIEKIVTVHDLIARDQERRMKLGG